MRPSKAISGSFRGKTHPPRYRFHKYWARKPYNIIQEHIKYYTRPGDTVLDPFCGSGVSVIESLITGRRAFGFDVNPVSVALVNATLSDIPEERLQKSFDIIKKKLEKKLDEAMSISCPNCNEKATIRYRVWSSVASCPDCGTENILARPGQKAGPRISRCSHCNRKLPLATVSHDTLNSVACNCSACRSGTKLFDKEGTTVFASESGNSFITNGRILAHEGLNLGRLFCKENWQHLHMIKSLVDGFDEDIRKMFNLVLSATAAQASRLIPFRQNLSTGGPAWTVPGFWVPKVHLQMNVFRSFSRRFSRLLSALKDLRSQLKVKDVTVARGKAQSIKLPDNSVDYIITDPPYGDSVPYLEFSQLWYHWLSETPEFSDEIVLSNSSDRSKNLETYSKDLALAFKEMYRVLKPGRWLSCFFQNRSLDVWKSLGQAARKAGFQLHNVINQEAAVISAKSQLARSGSLTGDVILQFRKTTAKKKTSAATDWRKLAIKTAVKVLKTKGKASFEELASVVLTALWLEDLQEGDGDLGKLFDTEFKKVAGKFYSL